MKQWIQVLCYKEVWKRRRISLGHDILKCDQLAEEGFPVRHFPLARLAEDDVRDGAHRRLRPRWRHIHRAAAGGECIADAARVEFRRRRRDDLRRERQRCEEAECEGCGE